MPWRNGLRSQCLRILIARDWQEGSAPCLQSGVYDFYEGHFRKRWTVSGEYQVKLAMMLRVMQPAKNWSQ